MNTGFLFKILQVYNFWSSGRECESVAPGAGLSEKSTHHQHERTLIRAKKKCRADKGESEL